MEKAVRRSEASRVSAKKRKPPTYLCELCHEPRLKSRNHTICDPCDAAMKAQFAAEDTKRAQKVSHHRCRLCSGALELTRYFSCKRCVPDHAMETEDLFDDMESIGYGDEESFRPKDTLTEKSCARCKVIKPIKEFRLQRKHDPISYRSYCNPCDRIYTAETRARMKARRLNNVNEGVNE